MIGRDAPAENSGSLAESDAVAPLVRIFGGNKLGQIHAGNARKFAGMFNRFVGVGVTRHDAARLRAFFPNNACQFACIDFGNCDGIALYQKIAERPLRAPTAVYQ